MKKAIIILSIFLLCGCSFKEVNYNLAERNIHYVMENASKHQNTAAKGFTFYKPRDFSVLENDDFNVVLLHNAVKYYLNIDINAYHGKAINIPEKSDADLYFTTFSYDGLDGYLLVREGNNSYFYIKMVYNYSCIEVSVRKEMIEDAIADSIIILSSIKYNENVISSLINTDELDSKEKAYEIKKPKEESKKNILDVYEYDTYTE